MWKDLILVKFENGFRILNNKDSEDKFFVIDEVELKVGDEFRIGPNGYFEHIGNVNKTIEEIVDRSELVADRSYASILYGDDK
tara:strand:- start:2010 stop:2258 length:249 start_codon:yes stop_codon:yes gene_type:complete